MALLQAIKLKNKPEMKKVFLWIFVPIFLVAGLLGYKFFRGQSGTGGLTITLPYDDTVFPADIASPLFVWEDQNPEIQKWKVEIVAGDHSLSGPHMVTGKAWRPSREEWKSITSSSPGTPFTFRVYGMLHKTVSRDETCFTVSPDPVEAPIFVRSVPLPFKFARENMKKIRWIWGSVSREEKPTALLEDLPTCGNCHSFTPDGRKLAMDVDANNDKGAYVITSFAEKTYIAGDSIISWSTFQEGKFTYGLLSQISPDGRYVVSTLRDCEIFTDRPDLEISQLFFPFKGILVVYDRVGDRFFELEGANDTMFVQSNPAWTPDGRHILFCKAPAKHYPESGIHNGSVPKYADLQTYMAFEKSYTDRDSLMKFDIYKIPFNDGKGGKAVPVEGASGNGLSNYFPRVSPDGKWLIFCQAESFMLLQKDSKLVLKPMDEGPARILEHNTPNMNSWHSWSPNSKWLVFSSKTFGPYTQLFLTHINDDGTNTPPVYLDRFSFPDYANNIPEFVNTAWSPDYKMIPSFLTEDQFLIRNGEILQKTGDEQGAFAAFDHAISKFPGKPAGYFKRGRIFLDRKQYPEALKDMNSALELEKHSDYYVTRGVIHLETGETEKASADFNMALKTDPRDHRAYSYLGVISSRQGDAKSALTHLQKALDLYPFDFFSWYSLGRVQYGLHQFGKALDSFSSGFKYCDNPAFRPLLLELRGNCRKELNDYQGALTDYNAAIQLSPKDPSLYEAKADAEIKMGLKEEAAKSLAKARQLGSSPPSSSDLKNGK